jgi:hypothetical protein
MATAKKQKGRNGYPQHRYIVKFKTFPTMDDYHPQISGGKVIRYLRTSNLLKFVEMLDRDFPRWTFMEVFKWEGYREGGRTRLGLFTQKNKPYQIDPYFIKRWEK